jgi:hypothetical protein
LSHLAVAEEEAAEEVEVWQQLRSCISPIHPATDPSENHAIVEPGCSVAPTGHCEPSYLLPSIDR